MGLLGRTWDCVSEDVGLPGGGVGLRGRDVGLSGRDVGLPGGDVGLSGRDVGLSGRDVGLRGGDVGLHERGRGRDVGEGDPRKFTQIYLYSVLCRFLSYILPTPEVQLVRYEDTKLISMETNPVNKHFS